MIISVRNKSLKEISELCRITDGDLNVDLEIVQFDVGVDLL
jgi:hypothetical protein